MDWRWGAQQPPNPYAVPPFNPSQFPNAPFPQFQQQALPTYPPFAPVPYPGLHPQQYPYHHAHVPSRQHSHLQYPPQQQQQHQQQQLYQHHIQHGQQQQQQRQQQLGQSMPAATHPSALRGAPPPPPDHLLPYHAVARTQHPVSNGPRSTHSPHHGAPQPPVASAVRDPRTTSAAQKPGTPDKTSARKAATDLVALQLSRDVAQRLGKSLPTDTPEDIRRWIEERKRNWPSAANVARKRAELAEKANAKKAKPAKSSGPPNGRPPKQPPQKDSGNALNGLMSHYGDVSDDDDDDEDDDDDKNNSNINKSLNPKPKLEERDSTARLNDVAKEDMANVGQKRGPPAGQKHDRRASRRRRNGLQQKEGGPTARLTQKHGLLAQLLGEEIRAERAVLLESFRFLLDLADEADEHESPSPDCDIQTDSDNKEEACNGPEHGNEPSSVVKIVSDETDAKQMHVAHDPASNGAGKLISKHTQALQNGDSQHATVEKEIHAERQETREVDDGACDDVPQSSLWVEDRSRGDGTEDIELDRKSADAATDSVEDVKIVTHVCVEDREVALEEDELEDGEVAES